MKPLLRSHALRAAAGLALAGAALALLVERPRPAAAEEAAEAESSCIACHRNPDFLVTHPHLYEYFREWERSVHQEEGVTCSDCHGGDPRATTREAAHSGMGGPDSPRSAVNFANVPATCGSCHREEEEAYRTSAHFDHLVRGDDAGDAEQGPSCVTCHQSMNTLTLDVTTVEATCAKCHGEDNHPEVPDAARRALNRFLSIDRFYRYVAVREKNADARRFLEKIDERREKLSVLWHTFDLERIEQATLAILEDLQARRDAIRARSIGGSGSAKEAASER